MCRLKELEEFLHHVRHEEGVVEAHPAGSVYYTGEGNDLDVIALVTNTQGLIEKGFSLRKIYPNRSHSYRKDQLDIICLYNKEDYDLWVKAARVCHNLKLIDKEEIISVFEVIVDGH